MCKIIFTIDTEIGDKEAVQYKHQNLFNKMILGKTYKNEWGIKYILSQLKKNGFKGVVFLDVYPPKYQTQLKNLAKQIIKEKQELGLHTHPISIDSKRPFLFQYTKLEQKKIIIAGLSKIEKWTGIKPVAHRAGSYSINKDTLDILNELNLKFDFSYFHKHNNCKINLIYPNNIIKYKHITLVPVTVIKQKNNHVIFNKNHYLKLDINRINDPVIAYNLIKKFKNTDIVVFFMHSFSFVTMDLRTRKLKKNKKLIQNFETLLSLLRKDKNIKNIGLSAIRLQKNSIPETSFNKSFVFKKLF